jgi:hypothetical protein
LKNSFDKNKGGLKSPPSLSYYNYFSVASKQLTLVN